MSFRSTIVSLGLSFGLLQCYSLLSQYSQTHTYTISDGMPMTEIATVYCDNAGRIWSIHNNAWISCFDGRRFTNYPPEKTGHYSAGGTFYEEHNGMWVLSPGEISLYANQHWSTWKDPAFTGAVVDKVTDQIVTVDARGILYLFDTTAQSWKAVSAAPDSPTSNSSYDLGASLDENAYVLREIDPRSALTLNTYLSSSITNPQWKKAPEMRDVLFFWHGGNLIRRANPEYLFANVGFQNTPDITFSYGFGLGKSILLSTASPDPIDNAWIIEVFVFTPPSELHSLCQFHHPHQSVYLSLDHEGHLWTGSQGGLTEVFPEVTLFPEDRAPMISGMHVMNEDDRGRVWLGGYTTGLCYYDSAGLHAPPKEAAGFKRFLPGAYRQADGSMAFWTEDYGIVTYAKGKWFHSGPLNYASPHQSGYYFLPFGDNTIAGGLMNEGLGITTEPISPETEWTKINKTKGLLLDNVLTISEDQAGRLWCGRSSQGIALYDPVGDTAQTWLRADDIENGFGATASLVDQYGTLWFGSHNGLRFIPQAHTFRMFEDDLFNQSISVSMDEAGNTSVTLMKEHNGYLIFGNKLGYGFLELASHVIDPQHPRIFFYPTDKYLQSPDQNTVLIDSKGFLWIGQDLGATRIDFSHMLFDTLPVFIRIDSMFAGGENILDLSAVENPSQNFRLPTHKRNLDIYVSPSFTGLLHDNVGFQYRHRHSKIADTVWSEYSHESHMVFNYLPPGQNIVEFRAIKNNEVVQSVALSLAVPLTLSENPWFWICLVGGICLAGIFITTRFYRQQLDIRQTRLALKEKELVLTQQQREKEQLQIKAIANSLNPHFINNSLQWLQSRVRKDPDAVRMIDRFSKNIRTVFVNSRNGKAHHALGDEIELVRNYLYIQQARYGNFVDVSLPPDEVLSRFLEIQVPLMQLQIHVENAIEHGLRHRSGARKLSIDIQDHDPYIHIKITDDGAGRSRAKEIGSHGTQQGTQMLRSLHAIFNKHNDLPIRSNYQDTPFIDPKSGVAYGTTILIEIPKQYQYEVTTD